MKDDPWSYADEDEEIMKSAPNSPESERKNSDERPNSEMKSDKVFINKGTEDSLTNCRVMMMSQRNSYLK